MTTEARLNILPLGLNETEMRVLKSLIKIGSIMNRSRKFDICEDSQSQPDIFLVNSDDPLSMKTWRNIQEQWAMPTLFLNKSGEGIDGHPALRRPVIPARLFNALDSLCIESVGSTVQASSVFFTAKMDADDPFTMLNKACFKPGTKVLVAHGSEKIRKQIKDSLLPYQVSVELAASGIQASEEISSSFYDMVFLDTDFDDLDSYQFCRDIKEDKVHCHSTVVMVAKRPSHYRRMRASMANCDLYLSMPVSRASYYASMDKYLGALRDHSIPLTQDFSTAKAA